MVKFVRASMKGWKYAEANPDEAAMIVLENDQTGAQTENHQKRMMGEIAKLTAGSNGALSPCSEASSSSQRNTVKVAATINATTITVDGVAVINAGELA